MENFSNGNSNASPTNVMCSAVIHGCYRKCLTTSVSSWEEKKKRACHFLDVDLCAAYQMFTILLLHFPLLKEYSNSPTIPLERAALYVDSG